MIGRLTGLLIEKKPPHLLLEVNGVGYEVLAPLGTFYHLPELNKNITLHIHHVVREDAQQLFGFYKESERTLFRALIKVNGVGPKLALTILSGMEPEHFVHCILEQDTSSLVNIPGIGKKTAERLIVETRDSLAQWDFNLNPGTDSENAKTIQPQMFPNNQTLQDAMDALISLGYKAAEAKRAILQITNSDELTSEELIRLALRQMIKGKSI